MNKSLRILHVGNFSVRPKQAFYHNTERKLTNGFVRNGHSVLTFCDRDVPRSGGFGIKKLGAKFANDQLRKTARSLRPDLIVIGHGYIIKDATLSDIRTDLPDVKIAYWNVDTTKYPDVQDAYRNRLAVVDAVFSTSGGPFLDSLAEAGGPGKTVGFMPNPCDPTIETAQCFEHTDQESDLFFLLSSGKLGERNHFGQPFDTMAFKNRLEREIPDLVFEPWIAERDGRLCGGEYQAALANARMALNISKWNDVPHYSSDRISQLIGNGLLTFIPSETRLEEVIGQNGAVFYTSEAHLIELLAKYKKDDKARQNDARIAWTNYHERFNERIIANYIAEATFGTFNPNAVDWPSLVSA